MASLSSPRRRRRLAWSAAAVVPVVAVAVAVVTMPTRHDFGLIAHEGGAAVVLRTEKPIRLTPQLRSALDRTVTEFVRTAVVRRDLDRGWALASPEMRAAVSHDQWTAGDLPVFPYPANALRTSSWRQAYAAGNMVGIDVMLQPKEGSRGRVLVYSAELTLTKGRWLVDQWSPQATLGAAATPAKPAAKPTAGSSRPQLYDHGKLNARWLLLPLGVLSMLLVVPLVLLVRGNVRHRRAERAHRVHSLGER